MAGRAADGGRAWRLLPRLLLDADGAAVRRRGDEPALGGWPRGICVRREAAAGRTVDRTNQRWGDAGPWRASPDAWMNPDASVSLGRIARPWDIQILAGSVDPFRR